MVGLGDVLKRAEGTFALASRDDHQRVRELADDLVAAAPPDVLTALGADTDVAIDLRVATKLAISKQCVAEAGWSGRLAVVFAMWGERRRLNPRTDDNPTGEDALRVKLDQTRLAVRRRGRRLAPIRGGRRRS